MNRLFALVVAAAMAIGSTGCLHHNVRNDCGSSCGDCCGSCETSSAGILNKAKCKMAASKGSCNSCGTGVLGSVGGMMGVECQECNSGCNECSSCGPNGCGMCGMGGCGRLGCVAGPLGWQQGGLDYSSHLNPGLIGHNAAAQLNSRPFTPGPPSAQVAYPYYTVRGPRDFLNCNPPSIGR